jgi:catechol 2,3-dioxygenase-like lactoylglutathione lyase family enzyme
VRPPRYALLVSCGSVNRPDVRCITSVYCPVTQGSTIVLVGYDSLLLHHTVDESRCRPSALPPFCLGALAVDMRLEVVVLPVSDVDRAKDFYLRLGWRLDADYVDGDDFRVVQLTPPDSPCSIIFGTGITTAAPGSADGLYLVVADIEAARAELIGHGVQVSDVFHDAGGVFHHAGTTSRVPGPDPDRRSYASFASFRDPDGNGWMLQEITTRLPGR